VTGRVIPEPVFSETEYRRVIFERIYEDIAPHDPDGILRHEWLNARGAIARFSRRAIEIRVLDMQECPQADLAVLRLIAATLKALVAERWSSLNEQKAWPVEPLEAILLQTIEKADQAPVGDAAYLRAFGLDAPAGTTAQQLWQHLYQELQSSGSIGDEPAVRYILDEGTLARRLIRALGPDPAHDRTRLTAVCRQLCDCLAKGELFRP
jgi:gamma-glutamyl:cysteine ligase YbdK (ATP-grasp superfamily)